MLSSILIRFIAMASISIIVVINAILNNARVPTDRASKTSSNGTSRVVDSILYDLNVERDPLIKKFSKFSKRNQNFTTSNQSCHVVIKTIPVLDSSLEVRTHVPRSQRIPSLQAPIRTVVTLSPTDPPYATHSLFLSTSTYTRHTYK